MAAQNFIPLPSGTPIASKNAQYAALLREVVQVGNELKATMAQAKADGDPNFTAQLGFPATQQGTDNANALQAMLASSATDIAASSSVAQAISRLL